MRVAFGHVPVVQCRRFPFACWQSDGPFCQACRGERTHSRLLGAHTRRFAHIVENTFVTVKINRLPGHAHASVQGAGAPRHRANLTQHVREERLTRRDTVGAVFHRVSCPPRMTIAPVAPTRRITGAKYQSSSAPTCPRTPDRGADIQPGPGVCACVPLPPVLPAWRSPQVRVAIARALGGTRSTIPSRRCGNSRSTSRQRWSSRMCAQGRRRRCRLERPARPGHSRTQPRAANVGSTSICRRNPSICSGAMVDLVPTLPGTMPPTNASMCVVGPKSAGSWSSTSRNPPPARAGCSQPVSHDAQGRRRGRPLSERRRRLVPITEVVCASRTRADHAVADQCTKIVASDEARISLPQPPSRPCRTRSPLGG